MATGRNGRASRPDRSLLLAAFSATLLCTSPLAAAGPPSLTAQVEFQRLHPCPANDGHAGACPGYVVEHVVPPCLGGPDVAYNLRWRPLTKAEANDVRATRRCPAKPSAATRSA